MVFIPGNSLQRFTLDGKPVPAQSADSGCWLDAGEIAPYSVVALQADVADDKPPISGHPSPTIFLKTNILRVEFNSGGDITRIFDKKAKREVFRPTPSPINSKSSKTARWILTHGILIFSTTTKCGWRNLLHPLQFVEYGELRQTIEIKRKIQNSEFTQRISLNHNSPRLDFDTHINWNERHIMLKVAFPVDVLAPQATYEIQWGNVTRPTHRNTSWDWARFETCAQKWVDLSEGDYGVSLLNDCKYGHDIHDNVMRITLLRSPTMPDPMADFGEHEFKYSLYPHVGSWNEETQREAYLLNDPIMVYRIEGSTDEVKESKNSVSRLHSLVSVSSPNVIIETIKHAEDGDGIIVRLYESQRKRGQVQVKFGGAVDSAWVTNLLEENESALSVENDSILLNLKPYQIVTLRVKFK